MSGIYKSIVLAKNGSPVPAFQNGRTMHSRYDPEREAERLAESVAPSSFFVVAGVGGAYLLRALKNRFPHCIILAAEHSKSDIDFLMQIPEFRRAARDDSTFIFPVSETAAYIKRHYLPALYGPLVALKAQGWASDNKEDVALFEKELAAATRETAADYATQARFGKLWQRNILLNLREAGAQNAPSFPLEKTAFVAAAGPSLDDVSYIVKNRKCLFVVATDTAYAALAHRGIFCDAVISIDGQIVSAQHFAVGDFSADTLFVFDLCANPSAVRFVKTRGAHVVFARTGHPLSAFAARLGAEHGANFPPLNAGAGTVTMAAADFARLAGFKKIIVGGADFAYEKKAYMRGTYFDAIFGVQSSRTATTETLSSRLMCRTRLLKIEDEKFTTELLAAYRDAFEAWLNNNFAPHEKCASLYVCRAPGAAGAKAEDFSRKAFDFARFSQDFSRAFLETADAFPAPGKIPPATLALLPACAAIRASKKIAEDAPSREVLKLAHDDFLRYN